MVALIITYYWPPSGGSGVQRWVKFSKYLSDFGWEPIIYTPLNADYNTIDTELGKEVADIKTIRQPIFEFYSLYRKLSNKKGKSGTNPITQTKSLKQKFFLAIRGNCFIPDPKITWVNKSIKYLDNYLKENKVDIIISTGPPHSMHLIAKEVAKHNNIKWIADFRDPWTKIFYFKYLPLLPFAKRKYQKMEEDVLQSADTILTASPLVKKDFEELTSKPVKLITNGYDENDFKDIEKFKGDNKFRVSHIGLLVNNGNPTIIWEALSKKAKNNEEFNKALEIVLIGQTDEEVIESIENVGLKDKIINMGYQSHKVAIQEELKSNILLLPIRKEPETKAILPGKLFEYMACEKPILGIADPQGAMAELINQTKCGSVCDWNDTIGVENFIDDIWEQFTNNQVWKCNYDTKQFTRKNLCKELITIMNNLVDNENRGF